jgi:hypothetical protein
MVVLVEGLGVKPQVGRQLNLQQQASKVNLS